MMKHYLRSAWRNLKRCRGDALVSVLGLSLGFAAALAAPGIVLGPE